MHWKRGAAALSTGTSARNTRERPWYGRITTGNTWDDVVSRPDRCRKRADNAVSQPDHGWKHADNALSGLDYDRKHGAEAVLRTEYERNCAEGGLATTEERRTGRMVAPFLSSSVVESFF